jgi:hypothetical protein
MQLHEFSDVVSDKLFAIGKWRNQEVGWLGGWDLACLSRQLGCALCFQIPCLINTKLMRPKC